jgi:hypothetical protein
MSTRSPKDRHPLRAVSAAVLVAAVIGTIAIATLPAMAATTAPALTAKLTNHGTQVTLHWRYSSDNTLQRDRKVEILRSAAGQTDVTLSKWNAGKTGSIVDTTTPTERVTYEARVLIFSVAGANAPATNAVPSETTPWSNPVTVDPGAPPSSSTTTTSPTTPPTKLGPQSCSDDSAQRAQFMKDLKAARGSTKPINEDARLDQVAYQRGVFFTQHGFDEHAGAGAAIGGTWAEVVAWQWPDESGAWTFWKGSPNHWPYMMSATYSKVGYACVDGNGGPWYTADFQG